MRYLLFLFCLSINAQTDLPGPIRALPATGTGIGVWESTQTHSTGFNAGTISSDLYWTLPTTDSTGTQYLFSNGAGVLGWGNPSSGGIACGTASGILYGSTGACSTNLYWTNAAQLLTVVGIGGNAGIYIASGFLQTTGGVLSQANVYNAIQSNTDGAVLRAYGVAQEVGVSAGGYHDYAQLLYPPSGSTPCYDAYGNLATLPIPLTGATFAVYSTYNNGTTYNMYDVVTVGGTAAYYSLSTQSGHTPPNATYWVPMGGTAVNQLEDVVVWNGPSPLQGYAGGSPYHINGTPCAAPPITNYLNGLNVSSYVFARYGFASDVANVHAIQLFSGGVQAQSYVAEAVYYAGQSTNCCGTLTVNTYLGGYMHLLATAGVPGNGSGCTNIASCNNPLISGDTLAEGMFYEESSKHHAYFYDNTSWREVAYYNDNITFAEILSTVTGAGTSFATTNANFIVDGNGNISTSGSGGVYAANGATGGFNVTADTALNSIQTVGGIIAGNISGLRTGLYNNDVYGVNSSNIGSFQISSSTGMFNIYAGNNSIAGMGVPPINYSFTTTTGSAISTTNFSWNSTLLPKGLYEITGDLVCISTCTGGSIRITISWVDGLSSTISTYVATANAAVSSPFYFITPVEADGANQVSWATSLIGTSGGMTYGISIVVKRLN